MKTPRKPQIRGLLGSRPEGFTIIEILIAVSIISVMLSALLTVRTFMAKQNIRIADRAYASQRAIQMMEELRGLVAANEKVNILVLNDYDQGDPSSMTNLSTLFTPVLTTDTSVTLPGADLSGNKPWGNGWRFTRNIHVSQISQNDPNARQVWVRVYYASDIQGTQVPKPLVEISSVLRTSVGPRPPTQVYDIYNLALSNVPGYWSVVSQLHDLYLSILDTIQMVNPGFQVRRHEITRVAYGRDPEYAPFTNDTSNMSVTASPWAYFYPCLINSDSGTPMMYFNPAQMGGQINNEGTLRNAYDPLGTTYPMADRFNNAMRYPDELRNYNRICAKLAALGTPTPEPSLRLLLDWMNDTTTAKQYTNAMVVNLHGELVPLPPVRNYSDAAKKPGAVQNPGGTFPSSAPVSAQLDYMGIPVSLNYARLVTHPEMLEYRANPATVPSVAVTLRVYPYVSEFKNQTNDASFTLPVACVYLPQDNVNSTSISITKIEGNAWEPYQSFTAVEGVHYTVTHPSSNTTGTLITLYNTPMEHYINTYGFVSAPNTQKESDFAKIPKRSFSRRVRGFQCYLQGRVANDLTALVEGEGSRPDRPSVSPHVLKAASVPAPRRSWEAQAQGLPPPASFARSVPERAAQAPSAASYAEPVEAVQIPTLSVALAPDRPSLPPGVWYRLPEKQSAPPAGSLAKGIFPLHALPSPTPIDFGALVRNTQFRNAWCLGWNQDLVNPNCYYRNCNGTIFTYCTPVAATPTKTNTQTYTRTPTNVPGTATFTATRTKTPTITGTPTFTPVNTNTITQTPTKTMTFTRTPTPPPPPPNTFTFTPSFTPTQTSTNTPGFYGGLYSPNRLDNLEYIPCPVKAVDTANGFEADTSGGGTAANGWETRFGDNLTVLGKGPKNTARWIIRITLNTATVNADGVTVNPHVIETRLGCPSGVDPVGSWGVTGDSWVTLGGGLVTYSEGVTQNLQNLSRTYVWVGDARAPKSEQYQYQGDPRWEPYLDVKVADGYNRYWGGRDYVNEGYTGFDKAVTGYGYRAQGSITSGTEPNGQGDAGTAYDVPRFYDLIRNGLLNTQAIWSSLNGWNFYYSSMGGEFGYDQSPLSSSLPLIRTPWDPTNTTSATVHEIAGWTGTFKGLSLVAQYPITPTPNPGSSIHSWYSRPWLGDLFPDDQYTTYWAKGSTNNPAGGNLPVRGSGVTFFRANQNNVGPSGRTAYAEVGQAGPGCFYNGNAAGSDGVTFVGSAGLGKSVTVLNLGVNLGNLFNFPVPSSVNATRPFRLTDTASGDQPSEWTDSDYNAASGRRTTVSIPSLNSNMRVFYPYDNDTSGTSTGYNSVLAYKVRVPDSRTFYADVNGLAPSGDTGPALLGKLVLIQMVRTFFDGGLYPTQTPGVHIVQVPMVQISSPINAGVIRPGGNPVTVNWGLSWTKWDGGPYTEEYPSPTVTVTPYAESVSMVYGLMYSSNEKDWHYCQDGSAAVTGTMPAAAYRINNLTYNWDTTGLSKGTYYLMVEAYRKDFSLHYSWHECQFTLDQ